MWSRGNGAAAIQLSTVCRGLFIEPAPQQAAPPGRGPTPSPPLRGLDREDGHMPESATSRKQKRIPTWRIYRKLAGQAFFLGVVEASHSKPRSRHIKFPRRI